MRVIPAARRPPGARLRLTPVLLVAILYGAAGCSPTAGLSGLARGAMAKLKVANGPAAPTTGFADASGRQVSVGNFRGRVVVLNLWANWCAPCKTEIPSLAALARAEAGAPVAIVPVSLGKGSDEAAGRAFIAAHAPLTFYSDPAYALPYALSPPVAEIPTTILFDRQGRERARLAGAADWSGPDAKKLIEALAKLR